MGIELSIPSTPHIGCPLTKSEVPRRSQDSASSASLCPEERLALPNLPEFGDPPQRIVERLVAACHSGVPFSTVGTAETRSLEDSGNSWVIALGPSMPGQVPVWRDHYSRLDHHSEPLDWIPMSKALSSCTMTLKEGTRKPGDLSRAWPNPAQGGPEKAGQSQGRTASQDPFHWGELMEAD